MYVKLAVQTWDNFCQNALNISSNKNIAEKKIANPKMSEVLSNHSTKKSLNFKANQ
jgi:hypothetical protein